MKSSPLDVGGEQIVPSVTRVFTSDQTLYVFFQAYAPQKADANSLRAGLVFFLNGERLSDTPMVGPTGMTENPNGVFPAQPAAHAPQHGPLHGAGHRRRRRDDLRGFLPQLFRAAARFQTCPRSDDGSSICTSSNRKLTAAYLRKYSP